MGKKTEAAAPTTSIKFIQLCGDADALYALDEEGRVFLYDDDVGWEQIELDAVRSLLSDDDEE